MIKFQHLKSAVSKRIFTFCYTLAEEERGKVLLYQFTIFNPSPDQRSWDRRLGVSLAFHRFNERSYKINVPELEVFYSRDVFVYLMLTDILNYFYETMQDIKIERGNNFSPKLLQEIRTELGLLVMEYEKKAQLKMIQRLNQWCFPKV